MGNGGEQEDSRDPESEAQTDVEVDSEQEQQDLLEESAPEDQPPADPLPDVKTEPGTSPQPPSSTQDTKPPQWVQLGAIEGNPWHVKPNDDQLFNCVHDGAVVRTSSNNVVHATYPMHIHWVENLQKLPQAEDHRHRH